MWNFYQIYLEKNRSIPNKVEAAFVVQHLCETCKENSTIPAIGSLHIHSWYVNKYQLCILSFSKYSITNLYAVGFSCSEREWCSIVRYISLVLWSLMTQIGSFGLGISPESLKCIFKPLVLPTFQVIFTTIFHKATSFVLQYDEDIVDHKKRSKIKAGPTIRLSFPHKPSLS